MHQQEFIHEAKLLLQEIRQEAAFVLRRPKKDGGKSQKMVLSQTQQVDQERCYHRLLPQNRKRGSDENNLGTTSPQRLLNRRHDEAPQSSLQRLINNNMR